MAKFSTSTANPLFVSLAPFRFLPPVAAALSSPITTTTTTTTIALFNIDSE